MTDPLATLRACCQRGVMPTFHELWTSGSARLVTAIKRDNAAARWIDGEACLDALAALQQALWPGSRVDIVSKRDTDGWHYLAGIWLPTGGFGENVVGAGRPCPAFDCAWLDAFLAGLEKDDG